MSETTAPRPDENSLVHRMYADPVGFLAGVEFPSDALSVRRLRAIFPNRLDAMTVTLTGFCGFFNPYRAKVDADLAATPSPSGRSQPPLVLYLDELINAERAVYCYSALDADGEVARCAASADLNDRSWAEESQEKHGRDKTVLESHYQTFKLADSPETARFLIARLEASGRERAEAEQSRIR